MNRPERIPHGPVFRVLIPPEPRRYSGQRWLKITVRAAHVVCAGIYLGALVFQADPAARGPWLTATLISGLMMLCIDLHESGAFLLQLSGLVVAAKLILLALAPRLGAAETWVVAVVAFVSVISSHASAGFRHFLIWGRGRIRPADSRG